MYRAHREWPEGPREKENQSKSLAMSSVSGEIRRVGVVSELQLGQEG